MVKNQREHTGINENEMLGNALAQTITGFSEMLTNWERSDFDDLRQISEQYYSAARQSGKNPDFYLLDENLNIIRPAEREAYPDSRILRELEHHPEEKRLRLIPGQDTDSELWLGKGFSSKGGIYYVLFSFPSRIFEEELMKNTSKSIVTDPHGWIYISNHAGRTDELNRFRPLAAGRVTYGGDIGPYSLMISGESLDGALNIYTIVNLKEDIDALFFVMFFIGLMFFILVISITYSTKVMADKKTKDIYVIIDFFERTRLGSLDQHLVLKGDDEFQSIGEAYNQMVDGLKREIEKNQEKERLLSEAQMQQLVSQFNPHFLFNTLENIKYICMLDSNIAAAMISSMSQILRYSLMDNKPEVTLGEDIEYTENYLSLFKYRFNRRFRYDIRMDSKAADYLVPRLIFQPLIENAVKYGFSGRKQLSVMLEVKLDDDLLLLSCRDDGCGMSPGQIEELRRLLSMPANKSGHTGLYNIHRRIFLMYGSDYGLSLNSREQEGTIIRIRLPARKES